MNRKIIKAINNYASRTTHTPEPWSVSDQYMEVPGRYVVGPDNELIADGWADTPMDFRLPDKSDVRGNMRIVAAGPDMLRALKFLVSTLDEDACSCTARSWYGDGHDTACPLNYRGDAIATIAKAEGRKQP